MDPLKKYPLEVNIKNSKATSTVHIPGSGASLVDFEHVFTLLRKCYV